MLASEAFIQNIGSVSEESVAWLNDEERGVGDSLQWNRQWQDHQSVHTAVKQAMARPPVCSHCSGTDNGKTTSLFTLQWNRQWQDHQSVHTAVKQATRAMEQAIARPSVCAHNRQRQLNRQWQDHQSVHTAVEQGMVRPSVYSHHQWSREWQNHQYVHMRSGKGNGKTISLCT